MSVGKRVQRLADSVLPGRTVGGYANLIEARLRKLGFEVPPSQANFVLARIPGRDMAPVTRGLRRAGILVRHFATPLLQDALRISIGTPAEMDALFEALAPLVRATPPAKTKRRVRG